jgi:glycosyltransferase involved in cell wall biosynthesis
MARLAILTSATGGGAGIAAKRVFNAIQATLGPEHTIELIDMQSLGEAVFTDVASHSGGSNKLFSDTHYTVEYPGYVRSFVVSYLRGFDVLNIHWCSYLITLTEIQLLVELGVKIVFTCHDFYYLFGGCHYPHTCTRWLTGCLSCPQLDVERFPSYSPTHNLRIKQQIFASPNVSLTAPSAHLVNVARQSKIVSDSNSHVIRNPVDTDSYHINTNRPASLLEPGKFKVLLIADSSHERRKGFSIALEALSQLPRLLGDTELEVAFVGHGSQESAESLERNGIKAYAHGHLKDPSEIARVYRSVDAVLSASLEDNWPNILVEAYACGTLAIVGPGHGCSEFVMRYGSGNVSDSYLPTDFAKAAAKLFNAMSQRHCNYQTTDLPKFSDDHSSNQIAKRFLEVYLD